MEARDRKESEKQGKKFPGYENKRKKSANRKRIISLILLVGADYEPELRVDMFSMVISQRIRMCTK